MSCNTSSQAQRVQPSAFPIIDYLPGNIPVLKEEHQRVLDNVVQYVLSQCGSASVAGNTQTLLNDTPTLTGNPYRILLSPQPISDKDLPGSYDSFWEAIGSGSSTPPDHDTQLQYSSAPVIQPAYPTATTYSIQTFPQVAPKHPQTLSTIAISQPGNPNWIHYSGSQQVIPTARNIAHSQGPPG